MGSRILDAVARLGGWLLCLAVLGVSFGESAVLMDFVVPGEVGMIVAGAAAGRNHVSPWALVAFGTVGAVLGDSFSYLVGRRWGMALVRRWGWLQRRLEPRFERAHGYFERRGGRAVFVARWVERCERWCRWWRAPRRCPTGGSCRGMRWPPSSGSRPWCGWAPPWGTTSPTSSTGSARPSHSWSSALSSSSSSSAAAASRRGDDRPHPPP